MAKGDAVAVRAGDTARPAPAASPLPFRLRPPRLHVDLVPRPRVLAALSASGAPLVLVSAGAGWGKTTALVQWVAADERPVAWLRLDAADNDPVVLLGGLIAALAPVSGCDPLLAEALRVAVPPVWETVVPGLAVAVAEAPPFLLVLDDAQHVARAECWNVVATLVDCLPQGAQIVVSTRTEPALPLPRLRAAGALATVGGADLAFDRGETADLLALLDLRQPADDIDALHRSTEGWATGLYLMAATAKGGAMAAGDATGETGASVEGATVGRTAARGDMREIAGYLLAEVFATQAPAVQDFLLHTAVLDRLSAPLCRAVTGRDDGAEVLAHLASGNLFVTPVDDTGRWWRYHQLFADFLRAELERREPDAVAGLCRRAGEWYLEQGDVPLAVVLLQRAGEHGRAADLVSDVWTRYWEDGRSETVEHMLRSFADDQVRAHVPLALTAGWVYSALGDRERARRRTAVACRVAVDDSPSPDGAASLRSSQALLRAAVAPDGVARMRVDAELAARLEGRPGSNWHAEAQFHLGCALWLTGVDTRAERHLRAAAREGGGVNSAVELAALGFLGLLSADRGDWDEARLQERLAAQRLAALGHASDRRVLPLLLLQTRLLARDRDSGLEAHVTWVAATLDGMVPIAWLTVLAGVVVGECLLAAGAVGAAAGWGARAARALREGGDAGVLDARLQRLLLGLKGRDSEEITPAELRVLALLPTHLALAQIAERLCVSTNTVKTHSKSLYRKLGVGSRAEAVEAARTLGLLPSQ
jgi:LuxR family maltose regulon positive regulatory protein